MPTTGASVALTGFVPQDDGFQVRKLREAGAVILGKTNLHELARGIETISSLGGQTLNPYDPRRNPGGSSGGTAAAIAANFAAVGMGSDTCGSIRIPAANNNLFGLRVTQGLSSRDGIIPLSHTQDVGGPLARSMVDLVTVLDITVGSDPADAQTSAADGHVPDTYGSFLNDDSLTGARLGLLVDYLKDEAPYGEVSAAVRHAVQLMAAGGAEVLEIQIDGLEQLRKTTSVIDMEFKFDLNRYLEHSDAPVKSLTEILESGRFHPRLEERFRRSENAEKNSDKYFGRLAKRDELAQLLLDTMTTHNLDVLVYPTLRVKPNFVGEDQSGSLCHIAAHSGMPAISLPAGFTPDGVPVGVELLARPFEEGRLIELGYAWEKLANPRRSPQLTPSLLPVAG
jgi:Asp-tRNA(Asn)/Glu-tRNA(Gln) amidotransferase A subunit family amidase